jgi:hypothetical protein
MIRAFVALILILFFSACEEEGITLPLRNGTYVGTFSIKRDDGAVQAGGVTFTFRGNTYSCIPENLYLPPSGAGSYRLSGNTLTLTDTARHTAEFDWTLILNGDFTYSFDGNILTLIQDDIKYRRYRTIELRLQK